MASCSMHCVDKTLSCVIWLIDDFFAHISWLLMGCHNPHASVARYYKDGGSGSWLLQDIPVLLQLNKYSTEALVLTIILNKLIYNAWILFNPNNSLATQWQQFGISYLELHEMII